MVSMEGFHGVEATVSFLAGWLLSHIIKTILRAGRDGWRQARASILDSGGMPSGHSASFAALTTYIGLAEGWNSTIFGLAVGVTIIVLYDAMNVRRAVGELGETMQQITKRVDAKIKAPKVVRGHRLMEVLLGTILGVIVGFAVFTTVGAV